MGLLLLAKCKCGFKDDKIYFGSESEEQNSCDVPALKNRNNKIEMKNILDKNNHLMYVFYTNSLLYKGNLEQFHNAGDYKLNRVNNFCPQCQNYNMEFILSGWF